MKLSLQSWVLIGLSDVQMVMLFDQAQTSSSALRQTKLDVLKR